MGGKFLLLCFAAVLALVVLPGAVLAQVQKKIRNASGKVSATTDQSLNSRAGLSPEREVSVAVNYYPASAAYIQLSQYYLLPGQKFTVSGAYFSPGEPVEVLAAGTSKTVTADSQGRFTAGEFSVTAGDVQSTVEVTAVGKSSGVVRKAVLKVGTYYPVVAPSAYYLSAAGKVTFNGSHFAPNENVALQSGKKVLANIASNASGNFNFDLELAASAASQQFVFTGQYTQSPVKVEIKVGP